MPVIPGIMPLQSYGSFQRLTKLCGTKVPAQLEHDLDAIRVGLPLRNETGVADNLQSQHDDQKVKDFGVTLAAKMISRLTTEADIKGVHFCTLNLERSVRKILEELHWSGGSPLSNNRLIVVC